MSLNVFDLLMWEMCIKILFQCDYKTNRVILCPGTLSATGSNVLINQLKGQSAKANSIMTKMDKRGKKYVSTYCSDSKIK